MACDVLTDDLAEFTLVGPTCREVKRAWASLINVRKLAFAVSTAHGRCVQARLICERWRADKPVSLTQLPGLRSHTVLVDWVVSAAPQDALDTWGSPASLLNGTANMSLPASTTEPSAGENSCVWSIGRTVSAIPRASARSGMTCAWDVHMGLCL